MIFEDRFTREQFVEELKKYFDEASRKNYPFIVPGLAEHFQCSSDDIVGYTGPFSEPLKFAILKCENYLLRAMATNSFNHSTGLVLLEKYHGYARTPRPKAPPTSDTSAPSMSDVLNEITKQNNG